MRVLVAGASGAIGSRLVLSGARVEALGAKAAVLDLLNPRSVRDVVLGPSPTRSSIR